MNKLYEVVGNLTENGLEIKSFDWQIIHDNPKTYTCHRINRYEEDVKKIVKKNSLNKLYSTIWLNTVNKISFYCFCKESDIDMNKSLIKDNIKSTAIGFKNKIDSLIKHL